MAPLAPTVVHARGSAPRRPVTRPFFHGLAPQQHTRLRALGLATLAVAVDAQQAKQRNAGALVQHRARVPDHTWMACRGSWFSPRGAERRVGQSSGEYRSGRGRGLGLARVSTGGTMCMPRGRGDVPGPWPGHRHARITQGWQIQTRGRLHRARCVRLRARPRSRVDEAHGDGEQS